MAKQKNSPLNDNELRKVILNYFYLRNKTAKSIYGKKGSAGKISDIKSNLKESDNLSQEQVNSNLTYLISQGWVEEISQERSFNSGKATYSSTSRLYKITAAGIDKIEGEGEFTRSTFAGINITATGQNIITLGDGNQVNSKFENVGNALNELKEEIKKYPNFTAEDKLNLVSDIDTIEAQLTKSEPSKGVIQTIWASAKGVLSVANAVPTLIGAYEKADQFITNLLS